MKAHSMKMCGSFMGYVYQGKAEGYHPETDKWFANQPEVYEIIPNPLGRYPTNIITEEIYD